MGFSHEPAPAALGPGSRRGPAACLSDKDVTRMTETTSEDGLVEALFRLPDANGAQLAWVVGEFNGWSHSEHPMERDGDGFIARIPLEPGRTYRFRYLLDGERWENDWEADAYVPNEFGGDDSVIDLTDVIDLTATSETAPPETPAPPTAAKTPAPRRTRRKGKSSEPA